MRTLFPKPSFRNKNPSDELCVRKFRISTSKPEGLVKLDLHVQDRGLIEPSVSIRKGVAKVETRWMRHGVA